MSKIRLLLLFAIHISQTVKNTVWGLDHHKDMMVVVQVYESNHSDNNLVGSIHGPCQVLPPIQYQQEIERQSKETSEALPPVFLCRYVVSPREPLSFLEVRLLSNQHSLWCLQNKHEKILFFTHCKFSSFNYSAVYFLLVKGYVLM
jgi:hypothetical protein